MLGRRDAPFPFEAVRDLLGVCRALAAAEPASAVTRRRRLASAEKALLEALDLAQAGHGTVGHRAAWKKADDAAEAIGGLVSVHHGAEPIVRAAMARVSGR